MEHRGKLSIPCSNSGFLTQACAIEEGSSEYETNVEIRIFVFFCKVWAAIAHEPDLLSKNG